MSVPAMRSCSERGVARELLEVPLTKSHPGTPRQMQFVRMELSTFQLLPQVPKLLIPKPWKSTIVVSLECFKLGLALQISLLKIYRLRLCLGFNPAPLSHAFRIENRMETGSVWGTVTLKASPSQADTTRLLSGHAAMGQVSRR